jgi:hypothetical protein
MLTKNSRTLQETVKVPRRYIPDMRMRSSTIHAIFVLCLVSIAGLYGCRRAPEAAAPAPLAAPEYKPDATIKDLMQHVVDTSADTVWLSVTTIASSEGLIETRPKNDEEWARVRGGAIQLAEAANLLMIPGRHVARPGEKSETPGVELEPEEMEKLINDDLVAWRQRATALHDAAMLALRAAEAKDADKIFEIGETIEMACENCHKQYWYPNEKIPEPSQ